MPSRSQLLMLLRVLATGITLGLLVPRMISPAVPTPAKVDAQPQRPTRRSVPPTVQAKAEIAGKKPETPGPPVVPPTVQAARKPAPKAETPAPPVLAPVRPPAAREVPSAERPKPEEVLRKKGLTQEGQVFLVREEDDLERRSGNCRRPSRPTSSHCADDPAREFRCRCDAVEQLAQTCNSDLPPHAWAPRCPPRMHPRRMTPRTIPRRRTDKKRAPTRTRTRTKTRRTRKRSSMTQHGPRRR